MNVRAMEEWLLYQPELNCAKWVPALQEMVMRGWRMLVWLVPPLILTGILAILYGPGLAGLWNKMPDDQFTQVQAIADEMRLSHPDVMMFQEASRNHATFEFVDVTDNDDQEELVSWFRDAKGRHKVTFEMTLEFYDKGNVGESSPPTSGKADSSGQQKKLLRRVEL
jgi:hypothetical protein